MRIIDVARYLIYLSYGENCYSLTPLKLQKILYYVQGWSYVWDGKPMFNEEFEAWQYGLESAAELVSMTHAEKPVD